MADGSFFKSSAVRITIIYISFFVISYLGANIIASKMVLNFLNDHLNSIVMERYREIETAYEDRGLSGAIDMINSHGPAIRGEETIYTLCDSSGVVIAGNATLLGSPLGFSTFSPSGQRGGQPSYKLFRGRLGENDLVVGISSGGSDELARIVLVSLGWTTAIVFAVGLGGAAVLRYRTRRRISVLTKTAHAIGHGELSRRLPISTRKDEIDILSSEINVALTRLEVSVTGMKQVTTDIAHDLKTPISRTFLVLDEALQAETVGDAKISVEIALAELGSIADTFDALLRIARIESRNRTTKFAMIDLTGLCRDIYETYEASACEEGYRLNFKSTPACCCVNGDIDLIRQMLANLVANAMHHTPSGSSITINVSQERGAICLAVCDDGPGIPVAERHRVFDRFYRLEKSRTSNGTGLGLSLVKAIAELHEAKIELKDNAPGLAVVIHFPNC
ncbi:Adaptive-response sensory-kinase SasA [Rhizobium rhizogenes]|uniref:histidine kinase n=1 Tax=Rhizobium rhizogenes TaxID=359 RepID=A0AAN2DGH6_RHIRH|nr:MULTISPECIES: HAMP domain-containing sensor histidine kinase [Rhizobium/Agrobacterium group]AQS63407.1 sensor histidine kinase [Rhizobium rhizogenes]MBO0129042.1 HAMP domain-containing histidine kinase [Agrobacterium sp. OT33]MCZ7445862.1 HAMP domain-containing sensor histidine kinase [Rhizobium rhizogenes]NSZ81951.1 HAMP domain-containing histidine kinase [Agrobacterium tumefaciens]OAM63063.1 ATPase [Rhizobium rhizogenes]